MSARSVPVAWSLARRTWRRTFERPVHLVFGFVQPLVWLVLFGFLLQRVPLLDAGERAYLDFLTPGVCVMTVLFGASQTGIAWIKDHQTGFLDRLLETPAPRSALLAGKLAADVARLLLQALGVALLALALGASLEPAIAALAAAIGVLALLAAALAALSSAIALAVRAPEPMATYVHLVNLPLFFTSTALVPSKQMPGWLAAVSAWNPLTLAVDELRAALLGEPARAPGTAVLVVLGLAAVCFALALSRMRPSGARERRPALTRAS